MQKTKEWKPTNGNEGNCLGIFIYICWTSSECNNFASQPCHPMIAVSLHYGRFVRLCLLQKFVATCTRLVSTVWLSGTIRHIYHWTYYQAPKHDASHEERCLRDSETKIECDFRGMQGWKNLVLGSPCRWENLEVAEQTWGHRQPKNSQTKS